MPSQTQTTQDKILNDLTRHLGDRILKLAEDTRGLCSAAGISDERFTLRLVEILGFLFISCAATAWPNMNHHQLSRITESQIDTFLKHWKKHDDGDSK